MSDVADTKNIPTNESENQNEDHEVSATSQENVESKSNDLDEMAAKRKYDDFDPDGEVSKKSKAESNGEDSPPAENKSEETTATTGKDKSGTDTKPITQHISYEEVAKIAAAHSAASTIQPVVSPSATTMPTPSTTINSTLSPAGDSLIIEVSQEKVGQIIGSKGAIIQDMQGRTGAKIYVNQSFPDGVNRQVNISGTPQQVQAAGDLVRRVILEGPTAIHVNSLSGGPSMQITIDCPQGIVGRVIGAGGAIIKELQTRSGAKIQINQDFPDGVPRKIMITGTQTAVSLATQLVSYVMENGPALPGQQPAQSPLSMFPGMPGGNPYGPGPGGYGAPSISAYGPAAGGGGGGGGGGSQTQTMECSKPMVGRIIGRKGETITMLQQKSGAKIQIEQSVIPCKIMITGNHQSIAAAMQLINELMATGGVQAGMPPMNPYGGAMHQAPQQFQGFQGGGFPPGPQAQFGGYGANPQPMPQQQQQQQYHMQQYAQSYPGVPQQAAAYGHGQQSHAYGGAAGVAVAHQAMAVKPLPANWSEHKTDDGNTYWYNSSTGTSQVSIFLLIDS